MRALEILSANLKCLAQVPGNPSSGPGVERRAKAMGLSIGRSSVGRYFIGQGNPSLDNIEALAKVFGVRAWQLLHPTMGAGIARADAPVGPVVFADEDKSLLCTSESEE